MLTFRAKGLSGRFNFVHRAGVRADVACRVEVAQQLGRRVAYFEGVKSFGTEALRFLDDNERAAGREIELWRANGKAVSIRAVSDPVSS